MVTPEHLPNAPITEAVIDLRTELSSNFEASQIRQAIPELAADYPNSEELRIWEQHVSMKDGSFVTESPADELRGFRFNSVDLKNIAQLRIDGFTISRMKPYTDWDSFFSEAMRLWDIYRRITVPEGLSRIAVRYINIFSIPVVPLDELSRYLSAPPIIAEGTPENISKFQNRTMATDPNLEISTIIGQSIEYKPDNQTLEIILDIDAFKTGGFNPVDFDYPAVFETLRAAKNNIFFGSITEETKGMFL